MLSAIDFDNQPFLVAGKIDVISPDRHLSSEFFTASSCLDRNKRQSFFSASVAM